MNNAIAELGALTSDRSMTSAQIRERLCMGECPALLAVLQAKTGVQGAVPSTQAIGSALRVLAGETGAIKGTRTAHLQRSVWSVESTPVASPSVVPGATSAKSAPMGANQMPPAADPRAGDPRFDPKTHFPMAPKGYHQRGVSTLLDAGGNPVMQWVKTTQDRDQANLEMLFEAIRNLPDKFKTDHAPVPIPPHVANDLLAVYPIGDPHLGMYAWAAETGSNYDVKIAEQTHVDAIRHLVAGAPSARYALVVSLGDFFHCNSNDARTERSGNPLDTDSRFAHVLQVGVRTLCAMVDAALTKHEQVRVICEIGNHDAQASAMLAVAMDLYYRNDGRVSVDMSPARFHYYRFGKCLFGTTHGSDTKAPQLPLIMAHDRAEEWGQTQWRKWLVGHVHHESVQTFPGCKVEFYRTLAGSDAWAHGKGYRPDRGMSLEVYHRDHGYVGGSYVGVNQLEAA